MVLKLIKKHSKKIGLPPGSMVFVGEKKAETTKKSLIDYDQEHCDVRELQSIEEAFPFKDTPTVTWLNICGLHDTSTLEKISRHFDIHQLVMEDIVNTDHRPKIEVFDNYVFSIIKMIAYDNEKDELKIDQLSLILGENFVITFQEYEDDIFDPLRKRIKNSIGRIRTRGPDYLFYALLDITTDYYFSILETLNIKIEYVDDNVVENPDPSLVGSIQKIKREILFLRKSIWPLREMVNTLIREEHHLIKESNLPYFTDLHDHTIQVVETLDIFRDMVIGILDLYNSSISNRMNEVMKVLTIIATIFIPLTLIVGIYGMNFEYMPELKMRWAYPVLWSIMICIFIGMLFYFRRKKWL
ncbi:magnesium transporter [bacterium SM23_31]|nr:MAG: magnesium transporter [bacterium SM23_31]